VRKTRLLAVLLPSRLALAKETLVGLGMRVEPPDSDSFSSEREGSPEVPVRWGKREVRKREGGRASRQVSRWKREGGE
jgi:hypothetical protein